MSRGPGRWQRIILEALKAREWCYLSELVEWKPHTRYTWVHTVAQKPTWGPITYPLRTTSDRLAAMRAAHTLARQGKIILDVQYQYHRFPTIVARPGTVLPDRWDLWIAEDRERRKKMEEDSREWWRKFRSDSTGK